MELNPVEIRVLGCLIEKQRTTPDAYPLTLNGLRAACNQSTNRDPVVDYDEGTIRDALSRLGRRRLTRLTSSQGSRAAKFRHLLDETLGLAADEQAVLAVLMLRGMQTPGELRARTERMHAFPDAGALQDVLDRLIGRELVERHPRRPGRKEERYAHRLGGGAPASGEPEAGGGLRTAETGTASPAATGGDLAPDPPAAALGDPDRLHALERRVAVLEAEVAALRAATGERKAPEAT